MLSGRLMSTPAILRSDIGSVLDPPERKALIVRNSRCPSVRIRSAMATAAEKPVAYWKT